MDIKSLRPILILLTISTISSSLSIHCRYKLKFYLNLNILYHCETENVVILSQNTSITSVTGIHSKKPIYDDKNNLKDFSVHEAADVAAIEVTFSVVYYFPVNLDQHLPNLRAISILNSKMREIHEKDLKKFPKLEFLSLRGNEIQVLEGNLFRNNKNLSVISFNHNHIQHIDPNIFNGLKNLKTLQLALNPCLGHGTAIDRDLKNVLTEVTEKCKPRGDESTNWKRQEVMDIENDCQCVELTMSAVMFAAVAVAVIAFVVADKFVRWRRKGSDGSDDKVELALRK